MRTILPPFRKIILYTFFIDIFFGVGKNTMKYAATHLVLLFENSILAQGHPASISKSILIKAGLLSSINEDALSLLKPSLLVHYGNTDTVQNEVSADCESTGADVAVKHVPPKSDLLEDLIVSNNSVIAPHQFTLPEDRTMGTGTDFLNSGFIILR